MNHGGRPVSQRKRERHDWVVWILIPFGVSFICLGVGFLISIAGSWRTYFAARSWPTVPAVIEEVEFEQYSGEDAMVYSVVVTYRYESGEQNYTGHRVGIMGGGSSNYELHRRRYEELALHRDKNIPFRAYVNPGNPHEALLYRETTEWMYARVPFGACFAGAGVAITVLGVILVRTNRELSRIAAIGEEREWDFRKEWQEGRIGASTVRELLFTWLLGLGLAVFVSMFVILMIHEEAPLIARLFIGALATGAVFLLLRAILLTARQLVFGTPVLCLQQVPVVPGREVLAAVRTARPLQAERWRFRLECYVPQTDPGSANRLESVVRRLESLPGKTFRLRSTSWYGERAYRLELPPAAKASTDRTGRAVALVAVQVPADAPESSLEPTFTVSWVLEAEAWSFPFHLKARFHLPVFYAAPEEIETKAEALG